MHALIGAILLGAFDADGELQYAGKVGTGFSERELDELLERLRPLARDSNPFAARRGPRDANFVEPRLVAEIEFREMTSEGMVRHGSFKGLREDKPAVEVGIERPEPAPAVAAPAPGGGEAAEWYARIGEALLPHLRGRCLEVPGGGSVVVEDLGTVRGAAREGAAELRTPLSFVAEPERPTSVVFELVAGTRADLRDCAQVALWIRGMLEQLGLCCYAKTAGPKALQVYLPLNTAVGYEQSKPFARAVAETLEAKFGDRVVARARAKRAGKVLIDWTGNDPAATVLSVYSLAAKRIRGQRAVSTPLEWEELETAVDAGTADDLAFNQAESLDRLEQRGDLFAPVLSEKQKLPS